MIWRSGTDRMYLGSKDFAWRNWWIDGKRAQDGNRAKKILFAPWNEGKKFLFGHQNKGKKIVFGPRNEGKKILFGPQNEGKKILFSPRNEGKKILFGPISSTSAHDAAAEEVAAEDNVGNGAGASPSSVLRDPNSAQFPRGSDRERGS